MDFGLSPSGRPGMTNKVIAYPSCPVVRRGIGQIVQYRFCCAAATRWPDKGKLVHTGSRVRYLKLLILLSLAASLGGCNLIVLAPAGDVAAQQRDLVVIATVLMLLIVLPVMLLTVFFGLRYAQET